MADITLSEARNKLERLQNYVKNVKVEGERIAREGIESVLVVGGGVASGALQAKMPKIPGTQIDSDGAIGFGLSVLAIFGILGKEGGRYASCLGNGLMAANAARETYKLITAPKAA